MVIHEADAVAVHAQPASVSTLNVPVVASLEIDVVTGESAYVQVCPACVTVKVWPPAVIVPVRALVLALAATR